MTHLDTSFLVDLLREAARGKEGRAHAVLDRFAEEELAVSVHVACELYAGAELADDPELERTRVASLLKALQVVHTGDRFAPLYGALLAELVNNRSSQISPVDVEFFQLKALDRQEIHERFGRLILAPIRRSTARMSPGVSASMAMWRL